MRKILYSVFLKAKNRVNKKENLKLNKKGFTLVELLACIAIMGIISVFVASFLSTSTDAYRKISSTTKIQETSQDSMNQIANIVRNSKSLKITRTNTANGLKITMESVNYEGKTILLVYVPDNKENDYGKIFVDYNYVVPQPEPGEEAIAPDITYTADDETYNSYLLTDMVKSFTVDYSKYNADDENGKQYEVVQKRVLDLSLTLERNEREFTQNLKAALRNSSPDGQNTELTIEIIDN